jgi:hypothetical protein
MYCWGGAEGGVLLHVCLRHVVAYHSVLGLCCGCRMMSMPKTARNGGSGAASICSGLPGRGCSWKPAQVSSGEAGSLLVQKLHVEYQGTALVRWCCSAMQSGPMLKGMAWTCEGQQPLYQRFLRVLGGWCGFFHGAVLCGFRDVRAYCSAAVWYPLDVDGLNGECTLFSTPLLSGVVYTCGSWLSDK